MSTDHSSLDDTRELADNINSFPTSYQPISETTLKDMLVSLRRLFYKDMMTYMQSFKMEVLELGGRVTHLEQKIGEYASSFNALVDSHTKQDDEVEWLKAKVEDRSHRNNVKMRGIPETIQPAHLFQYASEFICTVLPLILESDLIINRIHRQPKLQHLPDNVPRDILMHVHFYQVKVEVTSKKTILL